ncbi:MAG: gluconate 2-dehydrogenase subunit 3 family protein [Capsulimonas sp.]|uniref:gluconate 2-dehydrogenase subunit 3 family protein n=1 Tax=Capsulimonas sp. TaxID=2494211 RepID=UPI0032664B76
MNTVFTPQEIRTLQAAVNEIIPADDYPNGWDAGVGDYLVALMIRDPRFLPIYQEGLRELASASASGTEFHSAFFDLLVEHTMEGFYADPGNGGNKEGVAWRMIGYEVTA